MLTYVIVDCSFNYFYILDDQGIFYFPAKICTASSSYVSFPVQRSAPESAAIIVEDRPKRCFIVIFFLLDILDFF